MRHAFLLCMMMKSILLALLLSTVAYGQVPRTLNISELHPGTQKISGIHFPRTKDRKYRGGSEAQYSRKQAIAAMLGADEPLESILFSGMKLLLMGERCDICSSITNALQSRGFSSAIDAEIMKNDG